MSPNVHYKVLGLSADADWDEVKSAFRRLARIHHPDIAGPEGTKKFSEITEAYMTLKETIAGGASARRAREHPAPEPRRAQAAGPAEPAEERDSIFRSFWKKLFGGVKGGHEKESFDYDLPPARVRFLGSVISRAESEMRTLLSRSAEVKVRGRKEAIIRRLRSKHPSVVMLALQSISYNKDASNDVRRAVIDHFARNAPSSEILESLLRLFSMSDMSADLARALVSHAGNFSSADSMMLLKWLRRQNAPRECFIPFLSHPLDYVIAAALSGWPQNQNLPENVDILGLLKKDEESILVPLLRLMKKDKIPMWLLPSINKLTSEHRSPAVRVWASAIVRDQKLS